MESAIQEGTWTREDVKTLHGFHISNWPLKPTLEVDVYKAEGGLLISGYQAETGATIGAWPLHTQLAIEAWKAAEGLELDAYKTETGANIQNWSLKPQLDLNSYDAFQKLALGAYSSETNANIQNWPEKTRLDVSVWGTQGDLDTKIYNTTETAKNSNYSSQVSGYSANIQGLVGYLNAETARFASRIDDYKTGIQSEAERRGWSQLQLTDALTQADKSSQIAVEQAKAIIATTQQAEQAISQLMAGLTQAVYAAADYSLSGQGRHNVTVNESA